MSQLSSIIVEFDFAGNYPARAYCRFFNQSHAQLVTSLPEGQKDSQQLLAFTEESRIALSGQGQILEMIATGEKLNLILERIANWLEWLEPNLLATILVVNPNDKEMALSAAPTLPENYYNFWKNLPIFEDDSLNEKMVCELVRIASKPELIKLAKEERINYVELYPILGRDGNALLGSFLLHFQSESDSALQDRKYIGVASHLARIAVERTNSELSLMRAKEAAEAAAEAKSMFLANMSHEIRTPLSGILGLTDLALETDDSGEQRTYIEMVRDCSSVLINLINDILDFSKIESGKMRAIDEALNVAQWLSRNMSLLKVKADEKGLIFVSKVEKDFPDIIMADPIRLTQIFNNLVYNAIKFTNKDGSVFIWLGLERDQDIKEYIHFCVSDSGIGIPSTKIDCIFKSFEQVDTSASRNFGGTGLGLSITQGLVNMLGGKIWVDSMPGIGSAFHVLLPLTREPTSKKEMLPVSEVKASATLAPDAPLQGNLRIAIAEDNSINSTLIVKILERWGHVPTVFSNGRKLIEGMQENIFDVILMDCQMPEMDGFEAARAIRSNETGKGCHLPIIALTANANSTDEKKCLDAGMDYFLVKPIDRAKLQDLLNSLSGKDHHEKC